MQRSIVVKLLHKIDISYSLSVLCLMLLLIISCNLVATDDSNSKFIQISPKINDAFYKNLNVFWFMPQPQLLTELSEGSIAIDPKKIAVEQQRYGLRIAKRGVQYAWKSSDDANGQQFFDYISTNRPPLTYANDHTEYIKTFANNSHAYNFHLGLATVQLNKDLQDNTNANLATYTLPSVELDFKHNMLANLFDKHQTQKAHIYGNGLYSGRLRSLIIAGKIDGNLQHATKANTANNDGLVISNSDTAINKILYLTEGLIIAKTGKIQASEHKTGLKITSANAIIAGDIYNYGSIQGGTAIELGEEDENFPLISIKPNADLPTTNDFKVANFYNYGTIQADKKQGIAIKIKSGYAVVGQTNYITTSLYLYNQTAGEILGKIQNNDKIACTIINNGNVTIPATDGAIFSDGYVGNETSKLIIEFDDDFGDLPKSTTIINLKENIIMHPKSQIIFTKANNANINTNSIQQQITLINSEDELFIQNQGNNFAKYLEGILYAQTFTANDKKFIIVADAKVNNTNTSIHASFKIIEVPQNVANIIPASLTQKIQLIKTPVAQPKTNTKPANNVIRPSKLTVAQKFAMAEKLNPYDIDNEDNTIETVATYEHLTHYSEEQLKYYHTLIAEIIKNKTIKTLEFKTANNFSINNSGFLTLNRPLDENNFVFTLENINANTEIANKQLNPISFEYIDNIKKTQHNKYDLSNSTLYLGLTAYKKPNFSEYELGSFNYISDGTRPAFEIDLDRTDSFTKFLVHKKHSTQLKAIVITSVLDSTKSQQYPALHLHNSSNKDTSMNLSSGLIIANTGKLLASDKDKSKAALVIGSNKEKSMINSIYTTGNEKITTQHLISGSIYNYGIISGNTAIEIGEPYFFFPLKIDTSIVNNHGVLYNYGHIQANNTAVRINGEKTKLIKSFELINQKLGVIEGKLQADNHLADNSINFNVTNHGLIKIPATNNAIVVNNYKNTETGRVVITFANSNIRTEDAIFNIEDTADFDTNSAVILDLSDYSKDLTEHNIIHIPLLSSRKFIGDKDKVFHVKPIVTSESYKLYDVNVMNTTSGATKLQLEILTETEFSLEQKKSLPTNPVSIKNLANKINILKMLTSTTPTEAVKKIKYIHDHFIDSHVANYAFENSTSVEEYIERLMPNSHSSPQLSNHRIANNITMHINSRIMNKNIYNKYFYLQKSLNKLKLNEPNNNVEIWSTGSAHFWNNKSLSNKIKSYLASIGCDYEISDSIFVGMSYTRGYTNSTTYISKSEKTREHDKITTNSVSIYSRLNLGVVDVFASVCHNYSVHNIKASGENKPKFNSATNAFSVGAIYTTAFYGIHIDLTSFVGFANIHVDAHKTEYKDTDNIAYKDTIVTVSLGPTYYSKIALSTDTSLTYRLGINYKFISGAKPHRTNSEIINNHTVSNLPANTHSIHVNNLLKLFIDENIDIEFTLDGSFEKHSIDYGAGLAIKYLF